MATLLGTSFTDEEVVAQSDVNLAGTTVETLIEEFDQAKYEEALSSGSLSPKAMHKVHKVSKETKAPIAVEEPKEGLSFGIDCSNSLSSERVGSASAKLGNRVEDSAPAPKRRVSGHKRPIIATNVINIDGDVTAKVLKQAKKNAAQRRRRSRRRTQFRESRSSNQREPRVCEPQHDLCVFALERKPRVYVPKHEIRASQSERDPQWRVSQSKRGPQACVERKAILAFQMLNAKLILVFQIPNVTFAFNCLNATLAFLARCVKSRSG